MDALSSSNILQSIAKGHSLFQLTDPDILADPHVLYRALREHDPVYWDPYLHAWIVTSYPEVVQVLMTGLADRTVTAEYLDRLGLSFMKPFASVMTKQIMFNDGASHVRLRGLCLAAFNPRKVEQMRIVIGTVADELLGRVMAKGEMDVISDFAGPLPAIVTARLLGVPVEDHQRLQSWVLDLAEVLGNYQHHPDRMAQIVQSLLSLQAYVGEHIQHQRIRPNDGLLCALLTVEVEGQRLTDDEVIANTIVIMIGGHETTTSLIGGGFLTLLQRSEAYEQLSTHPEIMVRAVEELLRFECPSQSTARIAPADMQLGGKSIAKGARLIAGLAAANRDPNRFPDPDRLDLTRGDNRHLAFGLAAHFCLGAPLARMEGQIAFQRLLGRLSTPRLLEEKLEWRNNGGFRSLTSLRISFQPERG